MIGFVPKQFVSSKDKQKQQEQQLNAGQKTSFQQQTIFEYMDEDDMVSALIYNKLV